MEIERDRHACVRCRNCRDYSSCQPVADKKLVNRQPEKAKTGDGKQSGRKPKSRLRLARIKFGFHHAAPIVFQISTRLKSSRIRSYFLNGTWLGESSPLPVPLPSPLKWSSLWLCM